MARWTDPLLIAAAAVLIAAMPMQSSPFAGQVPPPGDLFEPEDGQRAVLLEFAEFHADPSSDGPIVNRLAAGTVLDYVGETTDAFGRTWFTVRDPDRLVRRRDTYLVPYDRRQFAAYGYRAAVLADRAPPLSSALSAAAAAAAAAAATGSGVAPAAGDSRPWWEPVGALDLGNNATFDGIVGISAWAPAEEAARQAISVLGGMDAIADWPVDPLPGQLFVPPMVPVLFQFDGTEWSMAQPVRLLGEALNLLGNGTLAVDTEAPPLAGGPALHCWDLVGALDPRNELAGSVAIAPPVASIGRGAGPLPDIGPYDLSLAPATILAVLPPAPPQTRVPARVDPPPVAGGVLVSDDDGRQAVYLRQTIGPEIAHRLRGMSLVLDVVARDSPRSSSAATFGINVEVGFADGQRPKSFSTSYTSGAGPRRFELAFEVPAEAETLTVRLLPLDLTLAVEQRGSVVFERVALRPASWDPEPPAASVLLYRVGAGSFEGALLHTRAAVAVTTRTADEIQRTWSQVAVSSWTDDDKSLVLAGEVRHGMTPEQVRAAWGEPAEETTSGEAAAREVRWDYEDRFAVFAGGKLVLFRPRQVIETRPAVNICPGGPPSASREERR